MFLLLIFIGIIAVLSKCSLPKVDVFNKCFFKMSIKMSKIYCFYFFHLSQCAYQTNLPHKRNLFTAFYKRFDHLTVQITKYWIWHFPSLSSPKLVKYFTKYTLKNLTQLDLMLTSIISSSSMPRPPGVSFGPILSPSKTKTKLSGSILSLSAYILKSRSKLSSYTNNKIPKPY